MISSQDVWIVDDDRAIRWVLERALSKEQVTTRSFETADDALKILDVEEPSVVITDVRMPGESGLSCLLYTSPSPRDQRGSRMASCA